jgi:hypothetical protein
MNPFSSLTIWIVLATIIPGLITVACIFIIINWVFPLYSIVYSQFNNWCGFSIIVAVMVVTQTLGILLGRILNKTYPKKTVGFKIANSTVEEVEIDTKDVFRSLYCVISNFKEEDDKHGHIQRIIGQYFLTLNSLVSYLLGFFIVIGLLFTPKGTYTIRVIIFLSGMISLGVLTYITLRIRYCVLIESLWSIRNIIADRNRKPKDPKNYIPS